MVPNAIALAGLVLTIVAIEVQVRAIEEPYLRTVHGDAYTAYAARVGRFLPALGRLDPATRRCRASRPGCCPARPANPCHHPTSPPTPRVFARDLAAGGPRTREAARSLTDPFVQLADTWDTGLLTTAFSQ
ncbi:hypothetical protein AB0H37_44385 [Actinomadura sp. NPDC023710]|uniref:methyltransferase family protein n=1 Tax=Actinomadura sp. NPDC023710 TaxID=3158219 RepID=UPI0033EBA167